ncbi:MAG: bis(5'-nucleosyl)-tetraphosphatase (symmetrical) YqeK [Spirochaetaceae bacterium]|nr:bis(5'-nucleosyl)-tetraphosphatase (symmetrical) YqeK [Spirochaetaceae bacterium]
MARASFPLSPAALAAALEERLDRDLSPGRAAHSRGVAGLAAALCASHGLDAEKGRAAGLAHDLCKELPHGRQAELASASGYSLSSGFLSEKILHGPAAAGLLRGEYGVTDGELLGAVAWHTVGRVGMGPFETIVYCADKIEPGRRDVDPAFRARCLAMPPAEMLRAVLEDTLAYLASIGRAVAPETSLLYNSLRTPERTT